MWLLWGNTVGSQSYMYMYIVSINVQVYIICMMDCQVTKWEIFGRLTISIQTKVHTNYMTSNKIIWGTMSTCIHVEDINDNWLWLIWSLVSVAITTCNGKFRSIQCDMYMTFTWHWVVNQNLSEAYMSWRCWFILTQVEYFSLW